MTTDYCPDPWTHDRWYRSSESTWRRTVEELLADCADNDCAYCGKPLPATKEEPCSKQSSPA